MDRCWTSRLCRTSIFIITVLSSTPMSCLIIYRELTRTNKKLRARMTRKALNWEKSSVGSRIISARLGPSAREGRTTGWHLTTQTMQMGQITPRSPETKDSWPIIIPMGPSSRQMASSTTFRKHMRSKIIFYLKTCKICSKIRTKKEWWTRPTRCTATLQHLVVWTRKVPSQTSRPSKAAATRTRAPQASSRSWTK